MIETVRFPCPYPKIMMCPICGGQCCRLCDEHGMFRIDDEEVFVEIQRPHLIKFLADNIETVSRDLSKYFGISPEVETKAVRSKSDGKWELVEIRTIQGTMWIAIPIEKRQPIYMYANSEVEEWLV